MSVLNSPQRTATFNIGPSKDELCSQLVQRTASQREEAGKSDPEILLPLPTKAMEPDYPSNKNNPEYLRTPNERAPFKLTLADGKFHNAQGQPPERLMSIYVMDAMGELYVNQPIDGKKKQMNHQFFLAEEPVACAGHLIMRQGELKSINNDSGHYKPPVGYLHRAVNFLKQKGVRNIIKAIDMSNPENPQTVSF